MSYSLKPIQAFSKHQQGSFKLVCDKDRHGNFAAGSTVAVVKVTPSDDGLVTVSVEAAQQAGEDGWKPTVLMATISDFLERHMSTNPVPPSKTEICDAVPGRKEWKIEALGASPKAAGSPPRNTADWCATGSTPHTPAKVIHLAVMFRCVPCSGP